MPSRQLLKLLLYHGNGLVAYEKVDAPSQGFFIISSAVVKYLLLHAYSIIAIYCIHYTASLLSNIDI